MKRKIRKYLAKTNIESHGPLEFIFDFYVGGKLEALLLDLGFKEVDIIYQIRNESSYLQIDMKKDNLVINVEFDKTEYDYIIYSPGISAEEFYEKIKTNTYIYSEEFSIEDFMVRLSNDLQNIL
jgi:hypothetical protein